MGRRRHMESDHPNHGTSTTHLPNDGASRPTLGRIPHDPAAVECMFHRVRHQWGQEWGSCLLLQAANTPALCDLPHITARMRSDPTHRPTARPPARPPDRLDRAAVRGGFPHSNATPRVSLSPPHLSPPSPSLPPSLRHDGIMHHVMSLVCESVAGGARGAREHLTARPQKAERPIYFFRIYPQLSPRATTLSP